MALESESSVLRTHSHAVVTNADQTLATSLCPNRDRRRPRVQRIFQQFLEHGSRTLDNLAGGDLMGQNLG